MSAVIILVIAIVMLVFGYVFYGGWLAKQWGIDPDRKTPAQTSYDGKDYVPANPAVLMGHHFSSIAGAGPINGPIQAAVFGWIPVFLWCVLGGIFVGGVYDFSALFASMRRNGGSVGELIRESMGVRAQRLFIIYTLAVLVLVVASFTSVISGTFASWNPEGGNSIISSGANAANPANASTAMTSMLFILIAIVFGYFVYRRNVKVVPATIVGIIGIVVIIFIGQNLNLNASSTFWIFFIAAYITIASLLPVWILLQPRDYLSSFLLYGTMILAVVSIIGGSFTGASTMEVPAYTGWYTSVGPLFPFLFITVACGACSGFHALISSGTTSKQISNEKDAQIISYGPMLIESGLGVISLIAIGVAYKTYVVDGSLTATPPVIFANGIAKMFGSFAGESTMPVIVNLLTLAVSVFALTSLDSSTRLCRYLVAEMLTPEGKTRDDLTGAARFFSNPVVSTLMIVIVGCGLGSQPLSAIWSVFGAANQLLAAIAMLGICTWFGKIGSNNKMFYFPMFFMLVATLSALVLTIIDRIGKVAAGGDWGVWFQLIWSCILVILAVDLAITSVKTLAKQKVNQGAN